jgi:hypothetical protein
MRFASRIVPSHSVGLGIQLLQIKTCLVAVVDVLGTVLGTQLADLDKFGLNRIQVN